MQFVQNRKWWDAAVAALSPSDRPTVVSADDGEDDENEQDVFYEATA